MLYKWFCLGKFLLMFLIIFKIFKILIKIFGCFMKLIFFLFLEKYCYFIFEMLSEFFEKKLNLNYF